MIAAVLSFLVVFSHLNDKMVAIMDVKGAARSRRLPNLSEGLRVSRRIAVTALVVDGPPALDEGRSMIKPARHSDTGPGAPETSEIMASAPGSSRRAAAQRGSRWAGRGDQETDRE